MKIECCSTLTTPYSTTAGRSARPTTAAATPHACTQPNVRRNAPASCFPRQSGNALGRCIGDSGSAKEGPGVGGVRGRTLREYRVDGQEAGAEQLDDDPRGAEPLDALAPVVEHHLGHVLH